MMQLETARTLRANIKQVKALCDRLEELAEPLDRAVDLIGNALRHGHKLLCCGNGGSAADCAHFTTEIAARFVLERPGFPAIDLTANHSLITALVNDFPPQEVFARQVQALGAEGDVLVAISTSGRSLNVKMGLEAAKGATMGTVALLGHDGGPCKGMADVELIVPENATARIQEGHLVLYHTICELLDPVLAGQRSE